MTIFSPIQIGAFLWYGLQRSPANSWDPNGTHMLQIFIVLAVVFLTLDAYATYKRHGLRPNNDYHLID